MQDENTLPSQQITQPPDWFTDALNAPHESRTVDVDGCAIYYRRWGNTDNPGLLLVPGNGCHSGWYSFIAPFLADRYNVAALDFSGTGDSGRRDSYSMANYTDEIAAVLEHAEMHGASENPVIAGHSFGGGMTSRTALKLDRRLTGIILIDALRQPVNFDDEKFNRWRPANKPTRVYPSLEAVLERYRLAPEEPVVNRYILNHLARTSVREVEDGWTWKLDPGMYYMTDQESALTSDPLSDLSCNIAALVSSHSILNEDAEFAWIAKTYGAKVSAFIMPDTGHYPMIDQPLALVAAIDATLAVWFAHDPALT